MPFPAVPLHVASAEAGGRPEGIGVVDEAAPRDGDRLEASVGVLGKARHHVAVVHPPAVLAFEVAADRAARERRVRAHRRVPRRVRVVVVHAEQERVDGLPGEAQGGDFEDGLFGVSHGAL